MPLNDVLSTILLNINGLFPCFVRYLEYLLTFMEKQTTKHCIYLFQYFDILQFHNANHMRLKMWIHGNYFNLSSLLIYCALMYPFLLI